MTLPPGPCSDDISAVRLRLLTAEEWNRILSGDPGEAARWVHAAAHHGFRAAQVTWGQMLLDGRGTARDPAAALRWFRRAAETGSIDGINMVGRCHELGIVQGAGRFWSACGGIDGKQRADRSPVSIRRRDRVRHGVHLV